ncbi:hypothetical protein TcasGA2_TC012920 [Tribolium castaneum]|uniref:Uncharacterized protein n=1 Tax=Tribolium castaneum TaxID=7070 RepID=D6WC12_TRICA|nr:hypothetical protein TcasGA2_TC012920 [Tribolium castaneum]
MTEVSERPVQKIRDLEDLFEMLVNHECLLIVIINTCRFLYALTSSTLRAIPLFRLQESLLGTPLALSGKTLTNQHKATNTIFGIIDCLHQTELFEDERTQVKSSNKALSKTRSPRKYNINKKIRLSNVYQMTNSRRKALLPNWFFANG